MISMSLLRGFLRKEFLQALNDPRMKFILFLSPVMQLILFGIALSTNVKNIRLWTEPAPEDYFMQHIYQHSIASGWFVPSKYGRVVEPFNLLRSGKVDAALISPPGGLTKAVGRHEANFQFLIDATNVIQAQSVEAYMKNISNSVITKDTKLLSGKLPEGLPIAFSVRVLFNPSLQTSYFMIPGVMSMIICIVAVILTNTSITREKEGGTFEMLISAPISSVDVILGKTLPYVIISICDVPLILFAAIFLFGVPMRGSVIILLLASIAFVCSVVAIGTLISTFSKNQQQSMLGGLLFIFPANMFSGLMFPLENMPFVMKCLAYIDPLSHFVSILRSIMLKGNDFRFIAYHTAVLVLMAIIFITISFKRFRTTLQ